jgi:lysine 2-monooxygenase
MPTPSRPANGGPYDITIVGAGMAGLYSAWRLLSPAALQSPLIQQLIQENGTGQLQLCLLEQSDRVGGRLDSYTFHDPDGTEVTVELGGMRYQTSMQLVTQVIQALGLQSTKFPGSNNRLFYLRGTQIWENEIKKYPNAPVQLPYELPTGLLSMSPDDLFNWVVENVTGNQNSPNWTADQWQQFVTSTGYTSPAGNPVQVFNNTGFFEIGFWDLLYDQVGNEGYRYLTEAGAYDSNTINWNSALAMPYVASGDYSSSAQYLRLVGGYQTLPLALFNSINQQVVQFKTPLVGLTQNGNSGFIDLTIGRGPNKRVIQSKNVILCLPRRPLELLDPNTPFARQIAGRLNSVMLQPSFKLLLLFDTEWWKQVNIRGTGLQPYGPSITDLPLRMVWYFDDPLVKRADGRQAATKYWALLASYSDMVTEQFWIELRNTLLPGGGVAGAAIPAPPAMVNMALSQLGLVHGMTIPQPVAGAAVYKDWGADPYYGAGYHAWATHTQPYFQSQTMLQPVLGTNIFICGEAYSLDQGWVEGALRTTENVLTQYFQMPTLQNVRPEYVKKGKGHGH